VRDSTRTDILWHTTPSRSLRRLLIAFETEAPSGSSESRLCEPKHRALGWPRRIDVHKP